MKRAAHRNQTVVVEMMIMKMLFKMMVREMAMVMGMVTERIEKGVVVDQMKMEKRKRNL